MAMVPLTVGRGAILIDPLENRSLAARTRWRSTWSSATQRARSARFVLGFSPAMRRARTVTLVSSSGSAAIGTARPWRQALVATRDLPAVVRGPVLFLAFR